MPTARAFALLGGLALIFGVALLRMQAAQPGTAAPRAAGGVAWLLLAVYLALAILLFLGVIVAVGTLVVAPLIGVTADRIWAIVWIGALCLFSLVVAGLGIAALAALAGAPRFLAGRAAGRRRR